MTEQLSSFCLCQGMTHSGLKVLKDGQQKPLFFKKLLIRPNRRSLLKTPGTVADQELSNEQSESEPSSSSSENCNTDTYTETQASTHTTDEIATRRSARTVRKPERLNL